MKECAVRISFHKTQSTQSHERQCHHT